VIDDSRQFNEDLDRYHTMTTEQEKAFKEEVKEMKEIISAGELSMWVFDPEATLQAILELYLAGKRRKIANAEYLNALEDLLEAVINTTVETIVEEE